MKNSIILVLLFLGLTACSKDKKDKTSINIDNFNTCELSSYAELNSIFPFVSEGFEQDNDFREIAYLATSTQKSCTYAWNETGNLSQFHAILIAVNKVGDYQEKSFEELLQLSKTNGRYTSSATIYPTTLSGFEQTCLLWESNSPYPNIEFETHINNEVRVNLMYFTNTGSFTPNAEAKLNALFQDILLRIE